MSDLESIERMMRVNGRINAALIDGLQTQDWDLTDGLGGQSIRFQLVHLAHYRYGWLKPLAPDFLGKARATMLRTDDGNIQVLISDPEDIKSALSDGDEAALGAVQDAKRNGKSFERYFDLAMILARTLAHDANHRGLIMSILRINGARRPEISRAMYGFWGEQ